MALLSIDPGTHKSGYAIFGNDKRVIFKGIKSTKDLIMDLQGIIGKFNINDIVIGLGTGRKIFPKNISGITAKFIDEKYSSRDAKILYWKDNPPKGLWIFVPTVFRVCPVPIDDFAAVILGSRYLDAKI